jgi:hypothetical protein
MLRKKPGVIHSISQNNSEDDYKKVVPIITKCISRVTDDTYAQYFGDNRHKFYVEMRCNRPCFENRDVCIRCLEKKSTTKIQHSRLFDHGKMNEDITDKSHIYGGEWYFENVIKWGPPPSEIIEFALQYQKEARKGITMNRTLHQEYVSKDKEPSSSQDMPPRRKKDDDQKEDTTEKVKRTRKPKVGTTSNDIATQPTTESSSTPEPIKRTRKPSVISDTSIQGNLPEKKRESVKTKKKNTSSPYETLVNTPQLIYKEVALPTYMEQSFEEFDIDGFEIEYIKLSIFQLGQSSYFRDSVKNKLYRKIKDKTIGEYVGRYDPNTESVLTDIPDSDDESE